MKTKQEFEFFSLSPFPNPFQNLNTGRCHGTKYCKKLRDKSKELTYVDIQGC